MFDPPEPTPYSSHVDAYAAAVRRRWDLQRKTAERVLLAIAGPEADPALRRAAEQLMATGTVPTPIPARLPDIAASQASIDGSRSDFRLSVDIMKSWGLAGAAGTGAAAVLGIFPNYALATFISGILGTGLNVLSQAKLVLRLDESQHRARKFGEAMLAELTAYRRLASLVEQRQFSEIGGSEEPRSVAAAVMAEMERRTADLLPGERGWKGEIGNNLFPGGKAGVEAVATAVANYDSLQSQPTILSQPRQSQQQLTAAAQLAAFRVSDDSGTLEPASAPASMSGSVAESTPRAAARNWLRAVLSRVEVQRGSGEPQPHNASARQVARRRPPASTLFADREAQLGSRANAALLKSLGAVVGLVPPGVTTALSSSWRVVVDGHEILPQPAVTRAALGLFALDAAALGVFGRQAVVATKKQRITPLLRRSLQSELGAFGNFVTAVNLQRGAEGNGAINPFTDEGRVALRRSLEDAGVPFELSDALTSPRINRGYVSALDIHNGGTGRSPRGRNGGPPDNSRRGGSDARGRLAEAPRRRPAVAGAAVPGHVRPSLASPAVPAPASPGRRRLPPTLGSLSGSVSMARRARSTKQTTPVMATGSAVPVSPRRRAVRRPSVSPPAVSASASSPAPNSAPGRPPILAAAPKAAKAVDHSRSSGRQHVVPSGRPASDARREPSVRSTGRGADVASGRSGRLATGRPAPAITMGRFLPGV